MSRPAHSPTAPNYRHVRRFRHSDSSLHIFHLSSCTTVCIYIFFEASLSLLPAVRTVFVNANIPTVCATTSLTGVRYRHASLFFPLFSVAQWQGSSRVMLTNLFLFHGPPTSCHLPMPPPTVLQPTFPASVLLVSLPYQAACSSHAASYKSSYLAALHPNLFPGFLHSSSVHHFCSCHSPKPVEIAVKIAKVDLLSTDANG